VKSEISGGVPPVSTIVAVSVLARGVVAVVAGDEAPGPDAVVRLAARIDARIHEAPANDWRLDTLSKAAGLSRSAFAAQFQGIERPNQGCSSDLTHLPIGARVFVPVAILDVASRKVLTFRVSNTMTQDFCVDALTEAIARYGAPEIVNTDQGSQFQSVADVLDAADVRVSVDGQLASRLTDSARQL
jgi:transposase InsO family protein